VSTGADPATKLLRVEAIFANNEEARSGLVVGDFVDVYVARAEADRSAILVPFSALLSGEQSAYSLYVVGSGSLAESRAVTIGDQNSHEIEITSGIEEGDRVIVRGALNVQPGDRIAESLPQE